jgi:hypothetical protein
MSSSPADRVIQHDLPPAAAGAYAEFLRYIVRLNWGGSEWQESSQDGTLLIDRPEALALGELLNKLGGIDLMRRVTQAALFEDGSGYLEPLPRCMRDAAISEINVAWNGIGEWQS